MDCAGSGKVGEELKAGWTAPPLQYLWQHFFTHFFFFTILIMAAFLYFFIAFLSLSYLPGSIYHISYYIILRIISLSIICIPVDSFLSRTNLNISRTNPHYGKLLHLLTLITTSYHFMGKLLYCFHCLINPSALIQYIR